MDTIITIIIILVISLGVFKIIKSVCKPIKTLPAILLVVPTVATCGIALLIFKFFRSSFDFSSYSGNKTYTSNNSTPSSDDIPTFNKQSKSKSKKPARSFTDALGKTTYYDEEDKYIGTSMDNGFGKKIYTDEEGNYVGESYDNGLGHTTYTDKDGNIETSNTNYRGEKTFTDGTTAKQDSSGNTYY